MVYYVVEYSIFLYFVYCHFAGFPLYTMCHVMLSYFSIVFSYTQIFEESWITAALQLLAREDVPCSQL